MSSIKVLLKNGGSFSISYFRKLAILFLVYSTVYSSTTSSTSSTSTFTLTGNHARTPEVVSAITEKLVELSRSPIIRMDSVKKTLLAIEESNNVEV